MEAVKTALVHAELRSVCKEQNDGLFYVPSPSPPSSLMFIKNTLFLLHVCIVESKGVCFLWLESQFSFLVRLGVCKPSNKLPQSLFQPRVKLLSGNLFLIFTSLVNEKGIWDLG